MTLNAPKYSIKGEKIGIYPLPEAVFGGQVKNELLAQAIRVYTSNQRQGTKKAQTRAEVSYTTKKVWRQKGTGQARHGSRRAPIFVGGGVAHGPTGLENYRKGFSKTMRRVALFSALSQHTQNKTIKVLEKAETLDGKTKSAKILFEKIIPKEQQKHILLVLDAPHKNVIGSLKNIPTVSVTQLSRLNVYEVMNNRVLVFTTQAIDLLSKPINAKKTI